MPKHTCGQPLLKSYADEASPVLFKALADETDVAVRSRIEEVLETIGEFPIPAETLSRSRAIRLLEQFKTEGAQAVLQEIAETDPPTTSSRDAKAELERLMQNRRAPPFDDLWQLLDQFSNRAFLGGVRRCQFL